VEVVGNRCNCDHWIAIQDSVRKIMTQLSGFEKLVDAIAGLNAHGDIRNDGTEVLWPDGYAEAQLWEIIYAARLISAQDKNDISAFHTPTRRAVPHPECVQVSNVFD
jgi:hypothetical protein